jgi:hypothetical protein
MARRTGVTVGIALALMVFVGGCKSKPPLVAATEADGKAAITRKLGSNLKLVDFKMTTSVLDEARKLCKMQYECEIEVTKDCRYTKPFRTYSDDPSTSTKPGNLFDLPPPGDPIKEGERVKLKGAILFEYEVDSWSASKVAAK